VLYDLCVNRLDPRNAFRVAFVATLPAMLLLPKLVAQYFEIGWSHDPRFFDVYWVPWLLLDWVYQKTGWWGGQSYAVAIQETVIGLVAALAVASLLRRSSAWQTQARLRAFVAAVGMLLPWWHLVRYVGGPDYYQVAMAGFSVAYCLAVVGAFLLSATPQLQGMLLVAALVIGGAFAVWQLEPWGWLQSGNLVASFGLLVFSGIRVVNNESVV